MIKLISCTYNKDEEERKVEAYECPICFDEKPIDSKFIYQNCEHVQCRECASEFFSRQIQHNNKINCVLCQKEGTLSRCFLCASLSSLVAILDLELVLPNDLVTKYLKTYED